MALKAAAPAKAEAGKRQRPGTAAAQRAAEALDGIDALQRALGNQAMQRLVVQRKCGCGGPCCKDDERVQRKADGAPPAAASAMADLGGSRPSGSPLPTLTRSFMESRFGHDFGGVRVHSDSNAASLASRLGAQAFTTGRDIYFAPGKYDPGSRAGQGLIAHELTHVVQQRSGASPAGGLDTPGDAFERQADAVARAVVSGAPVPRIAAAPTPRVQRATVPADVVVPRGCARDNMKDAGDFQIPPEKGPGAQAAYARHSKWSVRTTERADDTYQLRRNWKRKMKGIHGVTLAHLDESDREQFPKDTRGNFCTVDHVVESILHGGREDESEAPDNLMLMGGSRNSAAGGRTLGQVNRAREALGGRCIYFSNVPAANLLPPDECMLIEEHVVAWFQAQTGTTGTAPGAVILKFRDAEVPVPIPSGASGPTTIPLAALIRGRRLKLTARPGLELQSVTLPIGPGGTLTGPGSISAMLVPQLVAPFTGVGNQPTTLVVAQDGTVSWPAGGKMRSNFSKLSEAEFDFSVDEAGELHGEAALRPSLPILNRAIVRIVIHGPDLSARVQVPADQLQLPVPGLTLGGEGLVLGFEHGRLFASGQVTLQYANVAHGELRVTATPSEGISGSGQIDLTIPGLDRASGRVTIDNRGRIGGRITIGADKLRFPGVRSANLVVTIQDGALDGTGTLDLAVPGVRQAQLHFGVDSQGNYGIGGTALLSIPGTRESSLTLAYQDGHLTGAAHAAFAIPGLESAVLDVRYQDGQLSGAGQVSFRKGRLTGTLHAALDPQHKLSGGGELAYEIAPGLVGFAGVELRPDGTTHVQGGLRIPDTVELFARKQIEKNLFSVHLEIPIFAIPVGPKSVGLVATIGARLVGRAGIGPGQLRHAQLLADFDPSKDESAFTFDASAQLYVPADAEIALAVSGGIGLDLLIADAEGRIEAEAAAGLQGAFSADTEIKYDGQQLSVTGLARLTAQPKLVFRLRAVVSVELDLLLTTVEVYSHTWELAQFEAGSALQIGVEIPFRYVFGQPFELGFDQIHFIVPDINVRDLMKELLPS